MLRPAIVDIAAPRWTAFLTTIRILGFNFTGATFGLQVRLYYDAPGTPLVDLTTVTLSTAEGVRLDYGGTATVDAHIAAGRLNDIPDGMVGTDTLVLSLLGVRINETTMEGLPFPDERGNNIDLVWDLHITPSGGIKQKYIGGKFIVEPGATQ
jgi:hypothetical protein